MHEMLVAVDLLRRGFYVYRSLTPNSPCDLAIVKDDQFLRIEVKTGIISLSGKLSWASTKNQLFDILAVVEHSGVITYYPDLPIPESGLLPTKPRTD